jgi:uncharacterized protein (DUF2384 family)
MSGTWSPMIEQLDPAAKPEVLLDVAPLLARLVEAYPQAVVARLLGVDRSLITRWVKNEREISPAMRSRILEVHDVLTRVHQVFDPTLAARWLVGHEPLLGGARPIDVMGIRGAAQVIDALDAIASGGYA